MRLVLDTNVVIAGLLWQGPPQQLLAATIDGAVELFTTPLLLEELARALTYPRFTRRLLQYETSAQALVEHYTALVNTISAPAIPPTARDPDDDAVLACALAAQANLIVSGDQDLLTLQQYQGIKIVNAKEALERMQA